MKRCLLTMTTLSSIFPETKRLLATIQHDMSVIECNSDGGGGGDAMSIKRNLDIVTVNLQQMENLLRRENATRQRMWQSKVHVISEECTELKLALDKYVRKQSRAQRERDIRSQLLESSVKSRATHGLDDALRAQTSLQRSNAYINDLQAVSTSVIQNMREQRDILKSSRTKVLDVANLLGLSNYLLKLSDRREAVDRWIVWGGMLVTVVLLCVLFYYFIL